MLCAFYVFTPWRKSFRCSGFRRSPGKGGCAVKEQKPGLQVMVNGFSCEKLGIFSAFWGEGAGRAGSSGDDAYFHAIFNLSKYLGIFDEKAYKIKCFGDVTAHPFRFFAFHWDALVFRNFSIYHSALSIRSCSLYSRTSAMVASRSGCFSTSRPRASRRSLCAKPCELSYRTAGFQAPFKYISSWTRNSVIRPFRVTMLKRNRLSLLPASGLKNDLVPTNQSITEIPWPFNAGGRG